MSAQKDNEYKQNHYLAKMLLDRFTDKDGKLYCCRKENPRNIFQTTPKNVFSEGNLYIQYDENGKRDASVEKGLSQFEGKANEVIEKIVSSARVGMNPGLTSNEKKIWDEFFCKQWRRLPLKRTETISDDSLYKKCLDGFETSGARLLIMSAAGSMIQNAKIGYLKIVGSNPLSYLAAN